MTTLRRLINLQRAAAGLPPLQPIKIKIRRLGPAGEIDDSAAGAAGGQASASVRRFEAWAAQRRAAWPKMWGFSDLAAKDEGR